jgi:hypothetical protein
MLFAYDFPGALLSAFVVLTLSNNLFAHYFPFKFFIETSHGLPFL